MPRKRTAAEALAPYRRKRDFDRTPEPSGGSAPAEAGLPRFVVQRHRARRLHYDFRLEIGGVLASWAVPKGPTLDATVRRGAFQVEDHPIEYIDFEGVIPSGQYGGGDVIVWDTGTWRADETDDPARALDAGELHLDMYGTKLRGRFVLVRTSRSWLLLHKHDEYAVAGWDAEDHPRSVLTGRTNDEVKAAPDRMWRSDLPAARAAVPLVPSRATVTGDELARLDALPSRGRWQVFGRDLRVSNLDAVLYPARPGEDPVTGRELLRYAALIAPTILPYLTRRALLLHRFPRGAGTKGFWHRQLPAHAPDWLARWDDPDGGHTYLVVDEPAALVWAANFGALAWHPWVSRVDRPRQPTYAVIDLDPDGTASWPDLLVLARLYRTAFDHLGLTARATLAGRHGLHLWVPVAPGTDPDAIRAWVADLSRAIGAVVPDLAFPDHAVDTTPLAPYSPRPVPGAPVSTPIAWAELDDPALDPDTFTLRTILPRLADKGDLLADVLQHPQRLPPL
jgi:bifunctional non-homologous end joining protein LigD